MSLAKCWVIYKVGTTNHYNSAKQRLKQAKDYCTFFLWKKGIITPALNWKADDRLFLYKQENVSQNIKKYSRVLGFYDNKFEIAILSDLSRNS